MSGVDLLSSFRLAQGAAGTTKSAVNLAAENLLNANDPAYVNRTQTIDVDVIDGRISSIRSGIPQRVVDIKIVAAKRDQNSVVSGNDVKKNLLERLEDFTGRLDHDDGAIHRQLDNLANKAAQLTNEASSAIGRRNTVEAMKGFTESIQTFANGIQDQRMIAETGVMASVKSISELSNKLFSLNQQLNQFTSSSQEIDMSLLDSKREAILESMAKLMDIQVVRSDNSVFVYTSKGQPIVGDKVYELSYQSSGYIDYSAEYPTNINPIYIADDRGNKIDITASITQGQLGGYLTIRDTTCPSYQKTLDKFVEVFKNKINHIHNKGSGFPPAASLEGKLFVNDADKNTAINWKTDSTVRIAFVDDNGKFADSGGVFHVDLNLNPSGTSPLTPLQIRDAINTALGAGVAAFSEGDQYGYLTLKAPTGLRIAIGSVDGQTLPETNGDVGFSEYFKLNDLFESTPDDQGRGHSNTFQVSSRIAKDPALFSAGQLNSSGTIALTGSEENTRALVSGNAKDSVLSEFLDGLKKPDNTFAAAGVMSAQTTSFMDYLANMVNVLHLETAAAIDAFVFTSDVLDGLEMQHSKISGVSSDDQMGEIMMQKMFYAMIMTSSQKLLEMINDFLDLVKQS